jgi:hypothetical protein
MGERDDYEDTEPRRGVPTLRTLAVVGLCIVFFVILMWPLLWFAWALWSLPPGPLGPD